MGVLLYMPKACQPLAGGRARNERHHRVASERHAHPGEPERSGDSRRQMQASVVLIMAGPCWHPFGMRFVFNLFPVVSLRSTTG